MAVTQASSKTSSKGATTLQAKLRVSLRNNFMKPVATVAKLFAGNVPEIDALSMPKKQLSSAALVASAHAMADAAEKYSDTFTKNGLPQDFVAQLRSGGGGFTTSSPPTASASSGASSSGRSTAAAAAATASPASAAQFPAGSPQPA